MPTTPEMGLVLPTVSVTTGPEYANQVNAALTTVDVHDHTAGAGVPVPVAGLDIDDDLSFGANNATNMRSARFASQSAALAAAGDVGCLYVVNGDLFYNNESGTPVQITEGSAIDFNSSGTIGGDYVGSSASVFYTSAAQTFTFWQNTDTAAKLDVGTVTVRKLTASSPGIALTAPAGLSGSYSWTFPTALPGSTLPLSMSSAGVLSTGQITTAQITDVNVTTAKIADLNVTTAKIADLNVTTGKIASGACTSAKRTTNAVLTGTLSGFSLTGTTAFTSMTSLSITTSGRPLVAVLMPSGGTTNFNVTDSDSSGGAKAEIRISDADGALNPIYTTGFGFLLGGAGEVMHIPVGSISFVWNAIAGAHTVELLGRVLNAGDTLNADNVALYVYEL